jgi:uncharacterized membrane protein AbrB (regulator of aidB expression)
MTAPLALAIANAAIMSAAAIPTARIPRWLTRSSWLLLPVSLAALGLHLLGDAWDLPAGLLAIAFLISTCLNASALAPVLMQGLLARASRTRRRVAGTE